MAKTGSTKQIAFENYERSDAPQVSTDRSFGLVFSGFFAVVATIKSWPNLSEGTHWYLASLATLTIAFVHPQMLKPFNKIWMTFGLLLHRIMNPLVMGLLFFCVLTPMALLGRLFKWDPLRLKLAPQEKTYWIIRESSQTTDLKNQF